MKNLTENKIIFASFAGGLFAVALIFAFMFIGNITTYNDKLQYPIKELLVGNDKVVESISEQCNDGTELQNIYCVNNIISKMFNYTEHDDLQIYSPTKTLIEGGLCRDYALTYCSIFNKLDIDCNYHSTSEHVFNIINLKSGGYCIIDMDLIDCTK